MPVRERSKPRTRLLVAVAGGMLLVAAIGLLAVPALAATCSSSDGTMTIDLAGGESITISLGGAADPLTIDLSPSDPSCAGFDTSNTTTIHVNGASYVH